MKTARLCFLVLLFVMPDLQILQAQPTVQQVELSGVPGTTIGRYRVILDAGGTTVPVLKEIVKANAIPVTLGSVKQVTIQMFPGFNPMVLFAFGPNQNVDLKTATAKIICPVGFDYVGMASGGYAAIDVFTVAGAAKWKPGQTTFGPFNVPPDTQYFRAYAYEFSTTTGAGYVFDKTNGNWPPHFGDGVSVSPLGCLAWLTFVGN